MASSQNISHYWPDCHVSGPTDRLTYEWLNGVSRSLQIWASASPSSLCWDPLPPIPSASYPFKISSSNACCCSNHTRDRRMESHVGANVDLPSTADPKEGQEACGSSCTGSLHYSAAPECCLPSRHWWGDRWADTGEQETNPAL